MFEKQTLSQIQVSFYFDDKQNEKEMTTLNASEQ